jgi:hypothetical protein
MLHTAAALPGLVPSLAAHLRSEFVQNVGFSHEAECYTYREPALAKPRNVGGLITHLKRTHYPTYVQKTTKRRRLTLVKGSSVKQGKEVDEQLGRSFVKPPTHRMAKAILEYFASKKQTLQACQVPCWIPHFGAITQADCITRDAKGGLHLYEVKTGAPVGGFRQQGMLRQLKNVPNTKMTHWQLQLRYTRLGLEAAGVGPFVKSQVIQVHDKYSKKTHQTTVRVKIHPQADWAAAQIK